MVIGDDASQEASEAAQLAASIGRLFDAKGFLVHAYPMLPKNSEEEVDAFDAQIVEEAFRQAEKALEVRAAVGDAAALILGVAWEAEPALIAVGSRGLGVTERARRGYSRLGSVSTKVMRAARGPVLDYPHKHAGTT
jgi:nucleotide-binding universal stress UspA family protein